MAETVVLNNLIAGAFPIVTDNVTILSGEDLARGAVLGKVTSGGKYRECDIAAEDGSEDPKFILAETADASEGDLILVPVYASGEFNQERITLKGETVVADVKEALRALSIYLKTVLQ